MAMKRLPALSAPMVCFTRSKKYCLKMFGSSVVPDLLETMNRRLRQIDFVLERLDLRRIGGIEHVQFGEAGDLAEGFLQYVGAETGTAHAQQQDVGKIFFLDSGHSGASLSLCAICSAVMSSQPIQLASSVPVQSEASCSPQAAHSCRRCANRRCWP